MEEPRKPAGIHLPDGPDRNEVLDGGLDQRLCREATGETDPECLTRGERDGVGDARASP